MDHEKHIKLELYDAKIGSIGANFDDFRELEAKKFDQIKGDLMGLLKYVEEESREKNTIYEMRSNSLKEFEEKVF